MMSASQPSAGSNGRYLTRESDEDQDSSEDDDDEEENEGAAAADPGPAVGKGQRGAGRLSMSQPVAGTRASARPRRGRQSDLWK